MSLGFWLGMLFGMLLVIGLAVGIGVALTRRDRGGAPRRRHADPGDPMTALKASGALRHRKSNR